MRKAIKLVISLFLPFLAGLIGSLATSPAIPTWYASLTKPPFNPPNWIFGPVWTILYLLMGIALYRVWSRTVPSPDQSRQIKAVAWFIFHLVINALWSITFFGLQNPLLGLITIVILLALLIYITRKFYRLDRLATYLLIPYILWVSFATLLNISIWYLN